MKKIVYVIKSFANKAGTERVMSDKMNYLAEHGYDVTMITYEQGSHPFAFPLHPSIHHIDLNIRFFEIEKYGMLKHLYLLIHLRKMFRSRLQLIVDGLHPDIMVATTYSIKVLDIILSIKTDAQRIVESHVACFTIKKSYDYRHHAFLRVIASVYDRWMLGRVAKADLLVVLTKGDASDWRIYTKKILVIPNPVTNYPKSVLPHDGSGHRILCVGRLHEQKGFDLLIDAFAMIAHQCPEWKIDIFGEGSDKEFLEVKIRNVNLDSRIVINRPTDNIYNEYQHSEFFVLSSRYEGFALVLAEAMSCGIPCVAFKCKYGPEEVIDDGNNGVLVENGNVEELAQKILWMINHIEERLRMGENARVFMRQYELNSIMSNWLSLFEHISP